MPQLSKIDHIHVYVGNRASAESWYEDVLGFNRVATLEFWAVEGGPLTIANGDVHLALFERDRAPGTTIAFATDAANYQAWKAQLQQHRVEFQEMDHDVAWSVYFQDPDGNPFEITCYEHDSLCGSQGR